MNLNEIAESHWQWIEDCGWHNKTTLEYLALIASEVGEAVNECRGKKPTDNLPEELADIILRTLDLSQVLGIDIEYILKAKMIKNDQRGTRGRLK